MIEWCALLQGHSTKLSIHEFDQFVKNNQNCYKPLILFGEVMKLHTITVFHEIGIIYSIDSQYSNSTMKDNVITPLDIDLDIDNRKEIDRYLPQLSKSGSSYKLIQRMIGCNTPSIAHSYICRFSRQNSISSMTYENMLCKAYIICKKLGIVRTDESTEGKGEDVG